MNRLIAALVVLLVTTTASAQELQLNDLGKLDLGVADFGFGFEAPDERVAVLPPLPEDDMWSALDPLEGNGVLLVGGRSKFAQFDLRELDQFAGRRVEIRLWYQPRGTDVFVAAEWDLPEGEGRLDVAKFTIGMVATGRHTSDGWHEISTGPIDFQVAGVPLRQLRISDGEIKSGSNLREDLAFLSPDEAHVAIDGLTIEDLGPQQFAATPCALPTMGDDCGAGGTCIAGLCADGVVVSGNPPLVSDHRRANADRRAFEFDVFHAEPGRKGDWERFVTDLDAAVAAPRGDYYPLLRAAIERQRFGHGILPVAGLSPYPSRGLCLMPGVADLLPGSPQAPLLSVISEHATFQDLAVGDALIAIDGMPVDDWMTMTTERVDGRLDHWGQHPVVRQGLLTEYTGHYGATMTFARCASPPCAAEDIIEIDVSMGPLAQAELQSGAVSFDTLPCDLRLTRPTDQPHPLLAGETVEGLATLYVGGLPLPKDAGPWSDTLVNLTTGTTQGGVIDQRLGVGGSIYTLLLLTDQLVEEGRRPYIYAFMNGEVDANLLMAVRDCLALLAMGGGLAESCGYAFYSRVSANAGPATYASLPIAVLSGANWSANESILLLLSRRSAPLLLLGPVPRSVGWLSYLDHAATLDAELSPGAMQLWETTYVDSDAALDETLTFHDEDGVPYDEVCLQTQSDAVAGVDTCLERARQWVRDNAP